MNERETISLTLENMSRIYDDIGSIMKMIEEKARNRRLKPLGYSGVTWEVSTSLDSPASWLYRWFARAYLKDERPNTVVGVCVHLGQYEVNLTDRAHVLPPFPFVNVALINLDSPAAQCSRPRVLDAIWAAGWHRDFSIESQHANGLVVGRFGPQSAPAKDGRAYLLDLLQLTTAEVIDRDVVEPMARLFEGDEGWVQDAHRALLALEPKN